MKKEVIQCREKGMILATEITNDSIVISCAKASFVIWKLQFVTGGFVWTQIAYIQDRTSYLYPSIIFAIDFAIGLGKNVFCFDGPNRVREYGEFLSKR